MPSTPQLWVKLKIRQGSQVKNGNQAKKRATESKPKKERNGKPLYTVIPPYQSWQ